MPTVQILLATRNGAAYLGQQLDSLFAQTTQDFEVLVADDGSTDGTLALLDAAAAQHAGRIRILFRDRVGSAPRNFMRLLGAAEASFLMFCDQDDVWLPEKTELLLTRCRALQSLHPGKPVLVHSDLIVADAALRVVHPSFFEYQRMNGDASTFRALLLQGCVTGCAMTINRPLADLVKRSAPDDMVMHDWWTSLVAAAFGLIDVIRTPTVLYRQHGSNTLGAKRGGIMHFVGRGVALARGAPAGGHLNRCIEQADRFTRCYGATLRAAERRDCGLIAGLAHKAPFHRRYVLMRYRLLNQGMLRNIAILIGA